MGGASIQIDFAPGDLDLPLDKLIPWIRTAAESVTAYYGRFPVTRARILVVPTAARSGVLSGTTWGGVGGYPGVHQDPVWAEYNRRTVGERLGHDA